ncbi:flagellum-specific ATP synthase [Alphaproteobacteria bacterium]|nr:flagellum-specific ATP synthase [Alphaproteobacteria bacterium]
MAYDSFLNRIAKIPSVSAHGEVLAVRGQIIEAGGLAGAAAIGDYCTVASRDGAVVPCEVVGFGEGAALLMAFTATQGLAAGAEVLFTGAKPAIYPTEAWRGRIINALGEPADGKGPLPQGDKPYPIRRAPPSAMARGRVAGKLDLGVRSFNTFVTLCRGQRVGVFAGSGVGKSSLISMICRHTQAQVSVLALVGERGREAREFVEDDLGASGMERACLVLATSDESPLLRRQSAYTATALAEYFRDLGQDALLMMDSLTRFAMAAREIGLSAGEPPASKGYPPSVFSELPRLLERAGPGENGVGSITGIYTVLVEGDDLTEPIADATRSILDGHLVLSRAIAERGRFPAIDVLKSISRMLPGANTKEQNALLTRARGLMATYDDMRELIRLGAYKAGSSAEVDEAIAYHPKLEAFLAQSKTERADLETGYKMLATALDMTYGG